MRSPRKRRGREGIRDRTRTLEVWRGEERRRMVSKGEREAQPVKEEKAGADESMDTREEAHPRRKDLWVLRAGANSVRTDN